MVPRADPDPVCDPRPIDHLVARDRPGRGGTAPALVLRDGSIDHDGLSERVERLAGWLAREHQDRGARVASWAAKGELTAILPLAAARAGLVHVPINPLLKRAQVAHILADSGACLLIATPARLAGLEPGDLPPGCTAQSEAEALRQAKEAGLNIGPSDTDTGDLAAILYTSGSTGRPKGVMLSHANLWLGAVSVAHYLKLGADDVTLAVLPFAFDYGQNQLFSTWYAGGRVVPLDMLFSGDVAKACARHGVTTLAGVPSLWAQLVDAEWPEEATANLRRVTNSGGALNEPLGARMRATFGSVDIYAMYGLTEAFRSTFLEPALIGSHPTSIGTAIPFAEVLVVDEEGKSVEAGTVGELVHCGPLVAKGYWRDDARSAQRFRPAPPQSRYGGMAVWSGDRVRRDTDGLLHFVGRTDAMIKSAGNRISPQEIEDAALASGAVTQAIAIGVPDDRLGHSIHLVVCGLKDGTSRLSKYLQAELPTFMQPARIHLRNGMPLNPNGKPDRAAVLADILSDRAP